MFKQTIIKAIVYVFLWSILNSCKVHKSKMPQRPMNFKDSFLVSVLNGGDTISPECLDEIDNFKNGLTYTGDIVKSYIHTDTFDIAFFEVLPCLQKIKIASWYLLFPEMKYIIPWTNTMEPYYMIQSKNSSGIDGFAFDFKDSILVSVPNPPQRRNTIGPIGF